MGRENISPPGWAASLMLKKVISLVKEAAPSEMRMFERVKLTPFEELPGTGFEGSEKVKVSPPPERVKSSVSALATKGVARIAKDRSLMGRFINR